MTDLDLSLEILDCIKKLKVFLLVLCGSTVCTQESFHTLLSGPGGLVSMFFQALKLISIQSSRKVNIFFF